jgi:hypothetical protein
MLLAVFFFKWRVALFTVHIHEQWRVQLHCSREQWGVSGRTESGPKLNALNRVRPSKKNNFYFFNCVLFEKLEGDRLIM